MSYDRIKKFLAICSVPFIFTGFILILATGLTWIFVSFILRAIGTKLTEECYK